MTSRRVSLWSLVRGDDSRKAGWTTAVLLSPHLVLGTWLVAVPDQLAFRTSQIVLLLHVGLAVLSLPLVAWWIIRHWQRMVLLRMGRSGWGLQENRLFVALVVVAMVSGVRVIWGGRITPGHTVHAWSGLAIGIALGSHLWRARRRFASLGVAALLVTAAAGALGARCLIPPEPQDTSKGLFQPTSSDLYEPASYCGECHEQEYAEWSRSAHGRTMVHGLVTSDMQAHQHELGFDLGDYGAITRGVRPPHADLAIGSCQRCHIPTDFYGNKREDPRHPTGVSAEGITCSFCHSVRAVHQGVARDQPLPLGATGGQSMVPNVGGNGPVATDRIESHTDWSHILPRLPYYVSDPERDHRYLGEGSHNRVVRWLANTLIRWRPAVHRSDYDAPVLHTSQGCMPCHSIGDFDQLNDFSQKTYYGWEHSGYPTSDPETHVSCQDCHMVNEITGRRSHERGPFVPWGPDHEGHLSHLMLGGNTTVTDLMNDSFMGSLEHDLNQRVIDLALVGSRMTGSNLEVDVRVSSALVAHYLPSMATQSRYFWVEVSALDASGNPLATTPQPRSGTEVGGPTPVIFRCVNPARPGCDTVLSPHVPRVLTARLTLPAGTQPARIRATLHLSLDHQPLHEVTAPFPIPR